MGVERDCTPEEEAAFLKQWAEEDRKTADINKLEYQRLRRKAYPTIEEQLDMIYKDKINGTDLWSTTITSVKNLYPKT